MSVSAGDTQGWSFSLRHDPSSLQSAGGDFQVTGVTIEGTDTASVKNGSPPDFESTELLGVQSEGYTQGIVIDMESEVVLGPCSGFVTSLGCFRLDAPAQFGYYEVPISFTHDVADPPIESTIVQGGFGNEPCASNLTVGVYVSSYSQNYPDCTITGGLGGSESTGAQAVGTEQTLEGQKDNDSASSPLEFLQFFVYNLDGDQIYAVRHADLNLDGNLDLVAIRHSIPEVAIFWGQEDGSFSQPEELEVVTLNLDYPQKVCPEPGDFTVVPGWAYDIVIGDLNGDTWPDLAVACNPQHPTEHHHASGARIFWNTQGSPPFDTASTFWVSTKNVPIRSMALSDVDSDSDLDIVMGWDYGSVYGPKLQEGYLFFARNGELPDCQNPFQIPEEKLELVGFSGFSFIAAEEMLPEEQSGAEEIVGQTGVIGYCSAGIEDCWPVDWSPPTGQPLFWDDYGESFTGYARKFALGDLDGDTEPDFVVAATVGVSGDPPYWQLAFGKNTGMADEVLSESGMLQTDDAMDDQGQAVCLPDLNLDGKLDIVLAGHNEAVGKPFIQSFLNQGSAIGDLAEAFVSAGRYELAVGKILHLETADFNRDGHGDLLLSSENGYVAVYLTMGKFFRGDPNDDGTTNIADAVAVLQYLFGGGAKSSCMDTADTNDDSKST